ncbi:MAG: helix-turn-helix domain-containing protein, partial [Bdellovibrionales bacterium]
MKIFDYDNYKKWFIDWVDNRPNKGYGEFSKLAEFLNSSSTVISQIFKGDRDLSLEQAKKLAEFCQLTDLETKYLMQLALIARAGNFELKTYFEGEKNKIREECQQVKSRISPTRLLSDSEKALLVSSWMPTAFLILAGQADGINRAEAASE